jgi:hypothetical protein
VYGDPPILTSPHPRIYTHSYTAHFSTFSAQSVAHLCCAHLGAVITYVNSGINKDAMLCCFWACKPPKTGYYLGQLEECA